MTYNQAMSYEHRRQWVAPIQEELNSLMCLNVWTIVPRTSNIKPVPTKWLFTIKSDNTRKARLVAQGCRDAEKYKVEIASPTPNYSTVKWFLAYVTINILVLEQLDLSLIHISEPTRPY